MKALSLVSSIRCSYLILLSLVSVGCVVPPSTASEQSEPFVVCYQLTNLPMEHEGDELQCARFVEGKLKLEVECEVPSSIRGGFLSVPEEVRAGLKQLVVRVQHVNAVTISNEGPHLDLQEWVTYTSPWKTLKPNSSGEYLISPLSREEGSRFPKVSMDALRKEVLRVGDEYWASLVADINSPTTYPASVSTFLIRVEILAVSRSGKRETYVIEFTEWQGC